MDVKQPEEIIEPIQTEITLESLPVPKPKPIGLMRPLKPCEEEYFKIT
jgi:hypothetical protein